MTAIKKQPPQNWIPKSKFWITFMETRSPSIRNIGKLITFQRCIIIECSSPWSKLKSCALTFVAHKSERIKQGMKSNDRIKVMNYARHRRTIQPQLIERSIFRIALRKTGHSCFCLHDFEVSPVANKPFY